MKKFLKIVISLLTVGGLGYYLWSHWHLFSSVFSASWYHILSLVICILATWIIGSYQFMIFLKPLGIKVSLLENTALLIAMRLGNYLPMKTGTILRIQYYKKVHGLEYLSFTGMMGKRLLIIMLSTGIIGCVALQGITGDIAQNTKNFYYVLFTASIIGSMICLVLPFNKIKLPRNDFITNVFKQLSGILAIRSSPRLLFGSIFLGLLQILLLALRLYISFDAIQIELTAWVLLLIAAITTLLTYISITPGNLGLREWVIGLTSALSGINVENAIFAGTVDRAVLVVVTFIFGLISIIYIKYLIDRNVIDKK